MSAETEDPILADALCAQALRSLVEDVLPRLGQSEPESAAELRAEGLALFEIIQSQSGGVLELSDLVQLGHVSAADLALLNEPVSAAKANAIEAEESLMSATPDLEAELSDEEAMAMLAAMDAPIAPAAPQKAEAEAEMSDAEARALLDSMDAPAAAPAEKEMSDAEARALLDSMDAPAAAPAPKAPVTAAPAAKSKNAAADLLAQLGGDDDDDEEVVVARAPAVASAAPPAAAAAEHGDWDEIDEWRANDFQTDPDMVNDFITNTDELMTSLDDLVLQMENKPDDKEIIEQIFRGAHTLKGAAGMFGFAAVERVMHRMENLFDLVRKGKLRPSSDIVDLLFKGMDLLRPLLAAVKAGKPCGIKTGAVVRSLTLASQGIFETASGTKEAAPTGTPAAAAAAPAGSDDHGGGDAPKAGAEKKDEQTTIRVDLSRLDILVNLIGELVIDRTRFVTIEEELRTNHPQVKLSGNIAETVQLFGRHMNEIQDIIMKVRMVPTRRTQIA